MIRITVQNQTEGMRCLTNSTGGGHKIAVPPREGNGMAFPVEVTKDQFTDCQKDLEKLTRHGVLKLFASNGASTQEVPFVAVAAHFAKPGPKPEPLPRAPMPVAAPQALQVAPPEVEPVAPPPAPWMQEKPTGLDPESFGGEDFPSTELPPGVTLG